MNLQNSKELKVGCCFDLKMSEGELVMDVDSDLSLYHQVELPTAGLKPGLGASGSSARG